MIKTSKSKNLIKGQRLETNNSMYVNLPIYRTYLFVPPTYMMYLPIWHTYLYDVPTLLEVYLTTRTEVSLKWIFWVTEKAIGQVFSKKLYLGLHPVTSDSKPLQRGAEGRRFVIPKYLQAIQCDQIGRFIGLWATF